MTLESKLLPYEFLFRWSDEGEPQGAHMIYRKIITEDGVVTAAVVNTPQPITPGDAKALAVVSDVVNAGALARCADLEAALALILREKAEAAMLNVQLATRCTELEAALAAALRERDEVIAAAALPPTQERESHDA